MSKITGMLDCYLGHEGMEWFFFNENGIGPALTDIAITIEQGDHLKVFDEDGSVIFEGEIIPDYKTGWMEFPGRPGEGEGRQQALGLWVDWIQEGWQPDDWARLFVRKEDESKLRAELTKKKFTGTLSQFFVAGYEKRWGLLKNGSLDIKNIVKIETGDHLVIFDKDGEILFDDVIDLVYSTDRRTCTQKGWDIERWSEFFVGNLPRLHAELTEKKNVL